MDFKLGFLSLFVQIVLFDFAILFHVEKNKNFWLKLSLSAVANMGVCFLVEQFCSHPVLFILPFALNILLLKLCYKIDFFQAFFFSVIGYALQSLAYNLSAIVQLFFPFTPIEASDFVNYVRGQWVNWVIYAACVVASYFLFARKMKLTLVFNVKNIKLDIVCMGVVFVVYFVNMKWTNVSSIEANLLFRVIMILCITVSIWTVLGFASEAELARENAAIEQLLSREKSLQKISKSAIDTINRKCHDLKHTVGAIKAGGLVDNAEIEEIENALQTYDGFIKTGNADLDIVLAEKYLKCVDCNIALSCIIDGKQLDFMSAGDIYSLFGNLLDNAIEYLGKVDDTDNRLITVNVHARNKFVVIRVENYCDKQLLFEDGMPVTTNADKENHGWGTKSIVHIVEKYGGNTVFGQSDETFGVSIAIPV